MPEQNVKAGELNSSFPLRTQLLERAGDRSGKSIFSEQFTPQSLEDMAENEGVYGYDGGQLV